MSAIQNFIFNYILCPANENLIFGLLTYVCTCVLRVRARTRMHHTHTHNNKYYLQTYIADHVVKKYFFLHYI